MKNSGGTSVWGLLFIVLIIGVCFFKVSPSLIFLAPIYFILGSILGIIIGIVLIVLAVVIYVYFFKK